MNRFRNTLVMLIAIVVGIVISEIASRYIMPISPGAQLLTPEGEPVGHFNYGANTNYRQVSQEFDAFTSIDRYGNRVPTPVGSPDTVFIGDSFTFGHGVADDDTFVAIYCKKLQINCANLGKPGFGTVEEIDTLEHFLTVEGWRPKIVKLFFFGMTDTLMSGNDLYDNYLWSIRNLPSSEVGKGVSPTGHAKTASRSLFDTRRYLKLIKKAVLEYSNLGRFLYFSMGSQIRSLFSPPASATALEEGLQVTRTQLDRLAQLSEKYLFNVELFLIHPVQELLRGTVDQTIGGLQRAIPKHKFIPSAEVFSPNPGQYYFSYDGHFNTGGARKYATFLIKRDTVK
jgi:hypothetical protein